MTEPALGTLLRRDQRERWHRGERVLVESYCQQQPGLREARELVLDLIYNEIYLREEDSDQPKLEEYVQRFPEYASELQLLFEVHLALGAPSSGSRSITCEHESPTAPQSSMQGASTFREAIPGYQILHELGRGGMGVVYEALQVALKRHVALKMILSGSHAAAREQVRFLREAEAAARLQHPHIVQIYEVGEHEGRPYLALELVDGGSLAQKLAGAPQLPTPSAELVETLARAMHYAHQRGILHRDLKPANVLLSTLLNPGPSSSQTGPLIATYGFPKISDFGLAKLLDSDDGQTKSDAVIGTPNYMAPEQAVGDVKRIGPASDVYSLGAILYEMLTGRPPFRGATGLETLEQVRSQEVVPPRQLQAKLPRDLESICLKCLEKQPARRYPSALELADDLRRFLSGEPTHARPASSFRRAGQWVKRRPLSASLVATAVTAAAIGVALVFWHNIDLQAKVDQARADLNASHRREQQSLERQIEVQQSRQDANDTYRRFVSRRDDALFYWIYGTQESGEKRATLEQTKSAATEALHLVGLPETLRPGMADFLTLSEMADIRTGSYELLLVLAEILVQPPLEKDDRKTRVEKALEYLEASTKVLPPSHAYYVRRANYFDLLGQTKDAKRERVSARNVPPREAIDYFLLGNEQYRQGNRLAAIGLFEQALARQPDHFWAQFHLAFCYLDLHRPNEAKIALTASLARRPDFIWTYLLRGVANAELQMFDAAEADFHKAAALQPSNESLYALYLHRGVLRDEQGHAAEAVEDLQQAALLKPERFQPYLNLAHAYSKQKQFDQAFAELDRAMKLSLSGETLAMLHARRGELFFKGKRYSDSADACKESLKIHADASTFGVLGQSLVELRRYSEAITAFSKYFELGGRSDVEIYRRRAKAYLVLGKFSDAVHDLTLAIELKPTADSYVHRGEAHFFSENWKLAGVDFEQAIRLNPNDAEAYMGRGLVRVTLKQYRDAVEDANLSLRKQPKTPEAMQNVGCIFALAAVLADRDTDRPDHQADAEKFRNQAVEVLQKSLDLLPASERAGYLREKILTDTALDSIRHFPDFKRLLEKYSVTIGAK